MRLLLDTHVWFWALQSPEKLGKACSKALEQPNNELIVSTISTLELGQLMSTCRQGRLIVARGCNRMSYSHAKYDYHLIAVRCAQAA